MGVNIFYLITVLVGLFPFDGISSKTENTIIDIVFGGLIFLSSCFCYWQTKQIKLIMLKTEVYNNILGILLFTGFTLAFYIFFYGGS